MDMTVEEFYEQLAGVNAAGTAEDVEAFLVQCLQDVTHGCSMCFDPMEISVCNELGSFYRYKGDFEKSEEIFNIARNLVETHLGRETVQYATVLNNLAGTYRLAGKLQDAVDMFDQSALIYAATVGKENSYYCSILNNLALVYQDMEQYEKAEELLTESLKLSRTLEDSEMDVAITYSNLGALYLVMGNYPRAEEDLQHSIEIYEGLEKEKQIHLASVYNSLGILYYKCGKLKEAKEAYQQAQEQVLYHYGKNYEYEILERNIQLIDECEE